MSTLPESARFALWFSAWADGEVSLDAARDAVVADDAAHDIAGLDDGLSPLILGFGQLRRRGATAAGIALPVPGDPLGLAGPAAFTTLALEHGQAVVLDGTELGLVPQRAGAGVVWQAVPARTGRQVPDPHEADTALRASLAAAAAELAHLDVARWRPEVADELMALRRPVELPLPPGLPGRLVRLLGLGARCRHIVALALEDDGGAITALEAGRRREALMPLDHAARRAIVAACSVQAGR